MTLSSIRFSPQTITEAQGDRRRRNVAVFTHASRYLVSLHFVVAKSD